MKNRVLALLLVVAMIAGFAAGCGNAPAATNEAPAKTNEAPAKTSDTPAQADDEALKGTLNIFQFKVEINDALVAATKRYMELNPGVKVNLETVGGGDDYGAALRTKMQSSDQPAIYNIGGPQDVIDWAANLEDLAAEPWVANTVSGLLDDVSKDGKIYGMPMAIEGYGFVYNKEIFEAAGIDAASLKTFDQIDAAFAELKTKLDTGEPKDKFPALEAVMEYPAKE